MRELGPWLATIARRTAIDIYRREARRSTAPLDELSHNDPTVVELPVGVERSYEAGEIRAALDTLPPEERDVIRLQHLEELSQAEVAADFDISVDSVRRWVRQADIDDGVVDGQTSAEQNELVQLRREKRRLEMENEILRRAAAYFAAGSLPK